MFQRLTSPLIRHNDDCQRDVYISDHTVRLAVTILFLLIKNTSIRTEGSTQRTHLPLAMASVYGANVLKRGTLFSIAIGFENAREEGCSTPER